MRIAACQFAAGMDIDANTETAMRLIRDAAGAGADLAVLPEVSMYFDPRHDDGPGPHGQALDGPFGQAIAGAARAAQIAVVIGMLERADTAELGDDEADDAVGHEAAAVADRLTDLTTGYDAPRPTSAEGGGRDYNTLLALGADGHRIGVYRKIHLYDAFGFKESDIYVPGPIHEPLTFEIAGVRVAALTCYDLRFPEPFRWAVDAGAHAVVLPSAWMAGPAKEHHWLTLLAARAIENTVYVAGVGQTGPWCCGQSTVIDPMGTVMAGAGEQPGLAMADMDVARVEQVRRTNPSLANRRFGVVAARM